MQTMMHSWMVYSALRVFLPRLPCSWTWLDMVGGGGDRDLQQSTVDGGRMWFIVVNEITGRIRGVERRGGRQDLHLSR